MSKKFQLKNGLNVLLIESHKSPVVSVQMWVKTGSADEKKGEEGISHFIEHLVFKGTRKYGVGEIAATVEGSGGELNAYTSFDQTVFYVTISKEFTNVALDVISEMMGYPTFDPVEIDNEREVVIEEIKRGQDSPGRRASQMLFSTMYKKSPYGIPVIGFDKVVKSISADKIKKYFQSRYVPENMFLVVSGDFNSAEMKKKVNEYFGGFSPFKLKKVARPKEAPQKSIKISVEQTPFKQTTCYISWRIPNVKGKDVPALEVLAMILGQGDSSRLTNRLRIQKSLANGVGSFAYTMQDDGLFAVSLNAEKENLSAALAEISEELKLMLMEPPNKQELQKAITNFASHEVYALETVDNIARKAGSNEFYYGDHNYYRKYMKDIYALTPEEILRVARKYLKSDTFSLVVMTDAEEKETKKEVQKFSKLLSKALTEGKSARVKKEIKPSFKVKKFNIKASASVGQPTTQKFSLKSGATLLVREQSETPYVAMKMAMLGGVRIEDTALLGTTELFSRTWFTGSKNFSEDLINIKIDEMAAGMGAFGGRNSTGASMDYLSPFENQMYEIFKDIMLNPSFDGKILEREKTILKNQIKSRNDNPAQICVMNFMKEIFKGHPYSRDLVGTQESIDLITTETIRSYYEKMFNPKNMTFSIVGDVDTQEWVGRLNELTAQIPQGKKVVNSFTAPIIDKNVYSFTPMKKEQTHIIVGYQGLTLSSFERYTLEIMQSILSGQGGRLFVELRDKNSLAYTVSPMRMEGIECGYFGGYIGCSPEKSEKAISMLRAEFKKLADSEVSTEELVRAQRYIIGRHDIDLQRKGAVGNALLFDEIYGLDYRESLDVAGKYYAVSARDIKHLAEKIFSRSHVISLVGPTDIKDKSVLK